MSSHPFFAVTGDDGSFKISGLPAGSYTVEAWHERYGTKTAELTVARQAGRDGLSVHFERPKVAAASATRPFEGPVLIRSALAGVFGYKRARCCFTPSRRRRDGCSPGRRSPLCGDDRGRDLPADPDRRAGSRHGLQPRLPRLADLLRLADAEDGGRRAGRAQPPPGRGNRHHLDAGAGGDADLPARATQSCGALRPFGWLAVGLVVVQALLGGITVILRLPTPVSTAHTGTSLLFFLTLLYIAVRSRPAPNREAAAPSPSVARHGAGRGGRDLLPDGAGWAGPPLGRGARLHRRPAVPRIAVARRAPDRADPGAAPADRRRGGAAGVRVVDRDAPPRRAAPRSARARDRRARAGRACRSRSASSP